MTTFNASSLPGYNTTLNACTEHIDDVSAAVASVKNILSAFCESYVDVTSDVFSRRAAVSHNEFVNIFNASIEALCDVYQLLGTAKALVAGAAMIADSHSDSLNH